MSHRGQSFFARRLSLSGTDETKPNLSQIGGYVEAVHASRQAQHKRLPHASFKVFSLCFYRVILGKILIYLLKQAVRQLPTKPVDNSVYRLLNPALNYSFYYHFVKLYKNSTT